MHVYLEPREVDLLEKAATGCRDRLLVSLLFSLGCRISEAPGLSVQDIGFRCKKLREGSSLALLNQSEEMRIV